MFVKTIANNVPGAGGGGDRKSLMMDQDDDNTYDYGHERDEAGREHTDPSMSTTIHSSQHTSTRSLSDDLPQSSTHARRGSMLGAGADALRSSGKAVVGGVVGGSKAVVDGVVIKGSKAVVGGVMGGSKAVVDTSIKGSKAVSDAVIGGGKVVVDGVGTTIKGTGKAVVGTSIKGSKAVVGSVLDGVNQSSKTLEKTPIHGIAKKFENAIDRSANKMVGSVNMVGSNVIKGVTTTTSVGSNVIKGGANVVGGIGVGLGNTLLPTFARNSSAVIKETKEHHGNHIDDGVSDISESRHSDRFSERGSEHGGSGPRHRLNSSSSSRKSLKDLLGTSTHENGEDDGERSCVSKQSKISMTMSLTSSARRQRSFGGNPNRARTFSSSSAHNKNCPNATEHSSSIGTTVVGTKSGAEIITGKVGQGSATNASSKTTDDMGYGETAPSSLLAGAGGLVRHARRRASAFGGMATGMASGMANSIAATSGISAASGQYAGFDNKDDIDKDDNGGDNLHDLSIGVGGGAGISTGFHFESSNEPADEDMGYGYEIAEPTPPSSQLQQATSSSRVSSNCSSSASKKPVARRRASALGAVPAGFEASEEMPVSIENVHLPTGSCVGAQLVFGVDPETEEEEVGEGDVLPSPPTRKPKARRRASAFGALGSSSHHSTAVDMDYGNTVNSALTQPCSPIKGKKKKTARRRASALGTSTHSSVGYMSNDDTVLTRKKKPIAGADSVDEPGYTSCDGGLSSGKMAKKRVGRRRSALNSSADEANSPVKSKAKKTPARSSGKEDLPVPPASPKKKKAKAKVGSKVERAQLESPPTKAKKTKATVTANEEVESPSSPTKTKPKLSKDKSKKGSKKVKLTKEEVEELGEIGEKETIEVNGKKMIRVKRKGSKSNMNAESAEDSPKRIIKIKLKRKDKGSSGCGDGEDDENAAGGLAGAMNPMNMFKKTGSEMGKAVGGMFKKRPSMMIGALNRELSSRSLKSVSGRSDDDKSVRSMRSTRSMRSLRSTTSMRSLRSNGGVFGKAKSWFMKPRGFVDTIIVTGNNGGDTCGGMMADADDLTENGKDRVSRGNTSGGAQSETTVEKSEGPPTEIIMNKYGAKTKLSSPPSSRGYIIQKQWLAGGAQNNSKLARKASFMTTGTADDDSDSDMSSHGDVNELNKKESVDDAMSQVSYDEEPPLRRLPIRKSATDESSQVQYWKRISDERIKHYGTRHHLTVDAYLLRGNAELCAQDFKAATKCLLKAVSYSHLLYGDDSTHPRIARGLHLLGAAACYNDQLDLAEESTLNAFEMRRNNLGVCHVDTVDTFGNLGMIYLKMKHYQEAGRCFTELVQMCKAIYAQPHHSVAFANRSLAEVFVGMEDKKMAKKHFVKALRTFDKLNMTRDMLETEAYMTKLDIEIPLKEKVGVVPVTVEKTGSENDLSKEQPRMFHV